MLKNLVVPQKREDLTFTEVKPLLKGHYAQVSEIYGEFAFNKCNQKPEQNISEYIADLLMLASSYNCKTFLEKA